MIRTFIEILDDLADLHTELERKVFDEIICAENNTQIVRCKDCEYYDKSGNESESWEICTLHHHGTTGDNDFCSWAKMKGGNE